MMSWPVFLECILKYKIIIKDIDVLQAIIYAHFRNRSVWVFCFIATILIKCISFFDSWSKGFPGDSLQNELISALIWFAALFCAGLMLTIVTSLLNSSWREGGLGEHDVEITDTGVKETSGDVHSEIVWSSMNRVTVKRKAIFVIYSDSEALIIPKRSFSDDAWDEFKTSFVNKWKESKRVKP